MFSLLACSFSNHTHPHTHIFLIVVCYIFTETILRTIALFRWWAKVKSTVDSTHKMWITFIISAWPFGHHSLYSLYSCTDTMLVLLLFGYLIYFSITNIYAIWTVLSTTYTALFESVPLQQNVSEWWWWNQVCLTKWRTLFQLSRLYVCVCVCSLRHIKLLSINLTAI